MNLEAGFGYKALCLTDTFVRKSSSSNPLSNEIMSAYLQPIQREKLLQTSVTSQLNEQVDITGYQRPLHYPNFSVNHPLLAWRMEILGSITVLAALVAIAVVLVIYDNRPLPAWPHNITINTVVALLQQALNLGLTILVSESITQAK